MKTRVYESKQRDAVGSSKDREWNDLDMELLPHFLVSDRVENMSYNESEDSPPIAHSSSSDGSDMSSTEELMVTVGRPKRVKKMTSASPSSLEIVEIEADGQPVDRLARRRAQVANSARRLRVRKKNEMMTLKTQAGFLEEKLEALRSKHKQMRANNAVAAWEEKAIAQRHKRRQAEEANEQLRQALFLQNGFMRNLRSMFAEAMSCNIELNMRSFLHTPTRLLQDQYSRVSNLERVCTDAKLDMAKKIILEETGGIKAFTSPQISCQQIDLGRTGFGNTTVAVYALETRNAFKTFKATCNAILNCSGVWPNYTLVTSSTEVVDIPATKLHIRYGVSTTIYESEATGDQIAVESREISYYRMTEDCGIFLWDYIDADDMHLLQEETTVMRCTIGAVLVRPEICTDGVKRIVCRNICTKAHLVDSSELTPSLEHFSKSRELYSQFCGKLVYESIKTNATTNS